MAKLSRKPLWRLPLLSLLLLAAGCAGGVNYRAIDGQIDSGRCDAAAKYVEESGRAYPSGGRLLHLLDQAQVELYCGRHEESNTYFHQAGDLAEDLWTKSLTREAAAFLVSDYTTAYSGEDFERALINLFSALNYAALGDLEEALVECRQLDLALSGFNEKYEEKNVYKEDAFGRFLSGIIYEASGEMDDAFIDYLKAYRVYRDYGRDYATPMPASLRQDLARAAMAAGRTDELVEELGYRPEAALGPDEARGMGRIVFVHLNGKAPEKVEDWVAIPTLRGPIKIAFPRFVVRPPACTLSELAVESAGWRTRERAELVEDINSIAAKNLDDRKTRVVAKALARALVKQVAIEAASSGIEDPGLRRLAQVGLNIANFAIERADTRSWRTLPGEVYLAQAFVPEGNYVLSARLCGGREAYIDTVSVKAGETKFVMLTTRM